MTFRAEQPIALRPIEIRTIERAGSHGPAYELRDPLRLCEHAVVVPQALGPILALLDGSATYAELHALVSQQIGAVSGPALLQQILDTLDQALLLETEQYQRALSAARTSYRALPAREPILAGHSYPAEAGALRRYFDGLLASADPSVSSPRSRAILSPHIDYPRGGAIYAQAWKSASAAAQAAELVIMLATDHYSPEPLTLTRQCYATPYGRFPTDQTLVARLAAPLGEQAFAAELYHRQEHSVELVATWLHHVRAGQACTLIPILCGSFQQYTQSNADPCDNPAIAALIGEIQTILAERRTLLVISGDMAHVGPAFGDPPLNGQSERQVWSDDQRVISELQKGSATGVLESIRHVRDRNKICGLPPAYIALQALGATQGQLHGYARCPADSENTSAVTIAGMVFV